MVNSINVAYYFIIRAYEDGMEAEMTNMKALGYQKLDTIERYHPAYEAVMSKVLEDALNPKISNPVGKGEVRDWLKSLLD